MPRALPAAAHLAAGSADRVSPGISRSRLAAVIMYAPVESRDQRGNSDQNVPGRSGQTFLEEQHTEDHADGRVRNRDRGHRRRELPGRKRQLLNHERDQPDPDQGVELRVGEDVENSAGELIDRRPRLKDAESPNRRPAETPNIAALAAGAARVP